MRGLGGALLIAIGVLHVFYGLAGGHPQWMEMARDSFWNTVNSMHRSLVFWFTFFAFPFIFLGHLCLWVERRLDRRLPAFVGWELLAVGIAGVVFDPVSGFWLLLGTGVYMLARARRAPVPVPGDKTS